MTIVYELETQSNEYATLQLVNDDDHDVLLDAFDGTPMSEWWHPLSFRWETDGGRYPIPSYTKIGGGSVFSSHGLDAVSDLVEGRGELLPIQVVDDGDYTALNVTTFVDALDEDASDLVRFDDGEVMRVKRHVFHAQSLAEATIFKIPEEPIRTYVTDRFVARARAAGLTGLGLTELWRDE